MESLDGKVVCRFSPKADMPVEMGGALYKHRLFTPSAVNKYKQSCCDTESMTK